MPRGSAIILEGKKVALIKRTGGLYEHIYYVYPGGKVEKGETVEEATIREVEEETGLIVAIDRLIAEVEFKGKIQYYYLTKIIAGKFGEGTGPEMRGFYDENHGEYDAVWMSIENLIKNPVYPECVTRAVVESRSNGWPDEVIKCKDTEKKEN